MARSTVTEWECDNPACDVKRYAPGEHLPADGITGSVYIPRSPEFWFTTGETDDIEMWFAHTEKCIGPAVRAVMNAAIVRGAPKIEDPEPVKAISLDPEPRPADEYEPEPEPADTEPELPPEDPEEEIEYTDPGGNVRSVLKHITKDGAETLCGLDMTGWTAPAVPDAKWCEECKAADG